MAFNSKSLFVFLVVLLQETIPATPLNRRSILVKVKATDEDFGPSIFHKRPRDGFNITSEAAAALSAAGYHLMAWLVEGGLVEASRFLFRGGCYPARPITFFATEYIMTYAFKPATTRFLAHFVPGKITDRRKLLKRCQWYMARAAEGEEDCLPTLKSKSRLEVSFDDEESDSGRVYINDVEVKDWNIYNDGHVIVHGVPRLFELPSGVHYSADDLYYRF